MITFMLVLLTTAVIVEGVLLAVIIKDLLTLSKRSLLMSSFANQILPDLLKFRAFVEITEKHFEEEDLRQQLLTPTKNKIKH